MNFNYYEKDFSFLLFVGYEIPLIKMQGHFIKSNGNGIELIQN